MKYAILTEGHNCGLWNAASRKNRWQNYEALPITPTHYVGPPHTARSPQPQSPGAGACCISRIYLKYIYIAEIYVSDMKYLLMTDLSIYPTTPATVRTAAAEHGEAFPPCVPVPELLIITTLMYLPISILYFLDLCYLVIKDVWSR